jgi:glycosyltransferase involved in cell wall biosynthesis
MRVMLVGDYPPPGGAISGGVERIIDTLISELSGTVDFTLVVPNSSTNTTERVGQTRVIHLTPPRLPGLFRYWSFQAQTLRRIALEVKPNLVHIHGLAGWGLWLAEPTVVTVHSIPQHEAKLHADRRFARSRAAVVNAVERVARRKCGNIIVHNDYVRKMLLDIDGLCHETIGHPVDRRFLATPPCSWFPETPRILVVGRLSRLKNTLGALRLFSALARLAPRAELAVCGSLDDPREQSYVAACRRFVEERGLDDRVQFMGNLTTEHLIEEYDRSSFLLMLSHEETGPLVVVEAHARGLPVIALHEFGATLREGVDGLHLQGLTEAERAHELQLALVHNFDRSAIARRAAEQYAPERVAQRTLAFYEQVLARRAALHPRRR